MAAVTAKAAWRNSRSTASKLPKGRIERTQGMMFSADETADVGLDNQTPVALGIGYGPDETKFNGKIHTVTVEVKDGK